MRAFIYLFSSLLELYSRRKKLQKKRNKRFLPLLSYFQKLSDNLQASPPFFPRLGSRLCFSSLFFFFFPTFKLRRRKKEVLELEERSTYVISSRKLLTGPTKEAECAQTKLRFVHAPCERKYLYKGKCISDATRSLRVISMFRSLAEKLLFSTIK